MCGQVTKKVYSDIDELQKDLGEWIEYYNYERAHQGKVCRSKTLLAILLEGKKIWDENNLAQI